jgi:Cu/Ag efflux protein CusF
MKPIGMKSPRVTAAQLGFLLFVTGCATYQLPPPAPHHPAHLDAAAAPRRPSSTTLAYTAADIPSDRPMASLTMPPRDATSTGGSTSRLVAGEGEVIATMPNAGQIVLDHRAIPGFMEAMTMGYRIEPPSLLERVKPGDAIRFTIDVERRAIVAIEPLR